MKGNDEDLSRINSCASLTVLTSSNFKLIIILQMLSFLIMIGASNVVSANHPTKKANCPDEYQRQGNICVAKRTSYTPIGTSICSGRTTYYRSTGQCARVDPIGLLALDPDSVDAYTPSCNEFQTQSGGTCIQNCLTTHTMKNGKCHVKSSKLDQEYMICPRGLIKRASTCYNTHGARRYNYSLFFDCDHPSISNEWTKSKVLAELRGKAGRVIQSQYLDKSALSKNFCTIRSSLKRTIPPAWSTQTLIPARYVVLSIEGGDALYIDALTLRINGKLKQWGKNGGKGWCMSTQPKDGGGSWKNVTGNTCHRWLTFDLKTGEVKKSR